MYITMTDEEHQGFLNLAVAMDEGIHRVQDFRGGHGRGVEVAVAPGVKAVGTVWLCPVEGAKYGPCQCEA